MLGEEQGPEGKDAIAWGKVRSCPPVLLSSFRTGGQEDRRTGGGQDSKASTKGKDRREI